jgi:hypothetical protein
MSSLTKTLYNLFNILIPFLEIRKTISLCLFNTKYSFLLTFLVVYKSYFYSKGYSIILANSLRLKRFN